MQGLGIYIHYPFCTSRCDYCAFTSSTYGADCRLRYTQAVCREIVSASRDLRDFRVNTVYLGGGTPSLMSKEELMSVFDCMATSFSFVPYEVTIEANPDTVSAERCRLWREVGINRVSLGVQSLRREVLRAVGRHASAEAVLRAMDMLNQFFDNVSVDIMFGLPDSHTQDITYTLETLLAYDCVRHVSAYSLSVEDGTPLARRVSAGDIVLPDEDEVLAQYDTAYEYLLSHGFSRYEVSSFAREGSRSRHNSAYWVRLDYLGVGASAYSLIDNTRFGNIKDINTYIHNIENGISVRVETETIDREGQIEEYVMLGLRTVDGVDCELLRTSYGYDILVEKASALSRMADYITVGDGRICIRAEYYNVMNTIIAELI